MIYLDNAATSFPKPAAVLEEIKKCMLFCGGNPGRGAHKLSVRAAEIVYSCRAIASKMFGSEEDKIFFVPNTTYGINTVIKGVVRQGDHVLISDMEHNAVYRPIYKLAQEGKIQYDIFPTYPELDACREELMLEGIRERIRPNTRMLVCTHTSNLCPLTLPIAKIGRLCRERGIFFAVDGAQSAGHEEINVRQMNIDALCVPGHKGLYGVQGSGMVILGENAVIDTLVEGGNGVDSLLGEMSEQCPERYEAGTLAVPCIAGLTAGLEFVCTNTPKEIYNAEKALSRAAIERLSQIKGVSVYLPHLVGAAVLFNVDGVASERVAQMLDSKRICVRAGFHCAALAHKTLRLPDTGAVRVSFGAFNTLGEVDALWRAVREMK